MRDAPIKAVHVWLGVGAIVLTMLTGIFKMGQWSGEATSQLRSLNTSVNVLSDEVKKAAATAQEAREDNIRQDGDIKELKARPTPAFPNKWRDGVDR